MVENISSQADNPQHAACISVLLIIDVGPLIKYNNTLINHILLYMAGCSLNMIIALFYTDT